MANNDTKPKKKKSWITTLLGIVVIAAGVLSSDQAKGVLPDGVRKQIGLGVAIAAGTGLIKAKDDDTESDAE